MADVTGGDGEEGERNDDSDLPLDAVLGLLAHSRRRLLLQYFVNQLSDAADIDDLTEFVHRWESEADDSPSLSEIRADIRQTQVPALAEAGVLDYDDREETVIYRGSDRLERVHSAVRRHMDP